MTATSFLFICIVIALIIGVYNLIMMFKISKAIAWIFTHVRIVTPKQAKDPELTAIKDMFGIIDPPEDDIVDVIDDLDGKE